MKKCCNNENESGVVEFYILMGLSLAVVFAILALFGN